MVLYEDTLLEVRVWARSVSCSRTEQKEDLPAGSSRGEEEVEEVTQSLEFFVLVDIWSELLSGGDPGQCLPAQTFNEGLAARKNVILGSGSFSCL